MAHGGYARRRVEERRPLGRRSKGLGVDKRKKKQKTVSLKNQIRSTERFLRQANLPHEMREAQEKKLEDLKRQQEIQTRLSIERKIHLRDRKIKFFERRKIERMIRRLEKQQRLSSDPALEESISSQLSKLREDLEYVRFFPKSEKYVSLFVGGDKPEIVEKRNKLRKQIKANLMAAAASGKDLEETASDDDALDMSEDDFFLSGSSSDEAEADDEWTDKSTRRAHVLNFSYLGCREPASSGKAASGMSSDEKNQREISARTLMPPPRPLPSNRNRPQQKSYLASCSNASDSRGGSTSRNRIQQKSYLPASNNASNRRGGFTPRSRPLQNSHLSSSTNTSYSRSSSTSSNGGSARRDNNSNLSSNSDAHKPRRKRRPKKKKQV